MTPHYLLHHLLPPPYSSLEEILPFNGLSWYGNAFQLETLIRDNNVKTVVELGSWIGISTAHIASLLPPEGKVYAVDHWLGSADHHAIQELSPLLPHLYEQFLSNVIHMGQAEKITPVRMTTLEAAQTLNIIPDLVYVDASHDEESVYRDLTAWYPFVKKQGILCGDDWGWGEGLPVQRAVIRFAQEQQLAIETAGWFWQLKARRQE